MKVYVVQDQDNRIQFDICFVDKRKADELEIKLNEKRTSDYEYYIVNTLTLDDLPMQKSNTKQNE